MKVQKDLQQQRSYIPENNAGLSRRSFLQAVGVGAAWAATTHGAFAQSSGSGSDSTESPTNEQYLYVGTYSSPNTAPGGVNPSQAEGIYVYRVNLETGNLSRVQTIKADNPSFLAMAPSERHLYCVNELGEDEAGKPLGRVSAYKIDEQSGRLSLINSRSTHGTWPCHCAVHPSGNGGCSF